MRSIVYTALLALLTALAVGAGSLSAQAQPAPSLTSQEPPIRVAVEPVYQSVSHDGRDLSQVSTQFMASVPIRRSLQAYVRASIAQSDGAGLEPVRGLDDVRLGATYARALPLGSLVMAVDASLPTGKRNLSATEWRTAILTSQNIYDFRIGGFGQGFNAEPRLTWAVPVQENVMVGVGVGYTYRGAYEPAETLTGAYDPGNEIEVFGGADVRFGQSHAVSTDLAFTRFGSDTVDGARRYEARYKLSGTVQYLFQRDFTSLRVIGRLQHWPESRVFVPGLGIGANPVFEDRQVVPSEGFLRTSATTRLADWMDVRLTIDGQRYQQTVVQSNLTVATFRVASTFHLPGDVYVTPGVGYSTGDVQRLETRLRTEVRF